MFGIFFMTPTICGYSSEIQDGRKSVSVYTLHLTPNLRSFCQGHAQGGGTCGGGGVAPRRAGPDWLVPLTLVEVPEEEELSPAGSGAAHVAKQIHTGVPEHPVEAQHHLGAGRTNHTV